MEREQLFQIHVGNAVAVGEHERLIADVLLHALHAAAGHGIQAGIHHRDAPRLGMVLVDNHLVFAVGEVICNIGGVQEIIREILLDHMLLIPGADHKIVEAVMAVELHDMPEDRHTAQLYHGLGFKLAFFGNACSEAASENENFHLSYPLLLIFLNMHNIVKKSIYFRHRFLERINMLRFSHVCWELPDISISL